MQALKSQISKIISDRRVLAAVFIIIGLGVVIFFGMRSIRSYRQLQYVRAQGLNQGTASVEAIRPWMTIRYVSVAYAVPEEYIFAQLEIPFNRRNRNDDLGRLNLTYDLGPPDPGEEPPIVGQVADIILAYRENPVATGLDDIRPWMTIQYVANSTGVPADYLLESLGTNSEDNNAFKPLDQLAGDLRFEGGPRRFMETIKEALQQFGGTP